MADLSLQVFLKVKREDKEYVFSCENGADVGQAYSAYCEMGQWFVDRIKQMEDQKKPKPDIEPAIEGV